MKKVDKRRLEHRLGGLAMATFGGIVMTSGDPSLVIGGSLFLAEGLGDVISGDHHYISDTIISYLTRGKVNIEYAGDRNKYFIKRK